jgi:hypothetical protein
MQMAQHTHKRKIKKLKPAGHSAAIEALVQPAIVIASTLMSAIAAYVLASDELQHLLAGHGTPVDGFIVALCVGLGFLVDMAIIVSATRYKMHAVRHEPSERRWKRLSVAVLALGLGSESMTLLYFFVHAAPASFPAWLAQLADLVHSVLAVSRAFLPPVIVAYFAAGVLPVVIERADRNREIKSRTSQDIATLVDRLAEVEETDDKAAMLQALGGLLALNTYASYDTAEERLTEEEQVGRDAQLLVRLAQLHGLDWSRLQGMPSGRQGMQGAQISRAPASASTPVTPAAAAAEAAVQEAEELLRPLGLSRRSSS